MARSLAWWPYKSKDLTFDDTNSSVADKRNDLMYRARDARIIGPDQHLGPFADLLLAQPFSG